MIINLIILVSAYLLERFTQSHQSESFSINYENLEMLKPDNKQKLLSEVSQLTGKDVFKIRIRSIDYKKSVASLEITCRDLPTVK